MNILGLVSYAAIFTAVRFIRKNREAVLIDCVSYFIYFANVAEFIHGILLGHIKEYGIDMTIALVLTIFQVAIPLLTGRMRGDKFPARILRKIDRIHESVVRGFSILGIVGWTFLQIRSYMLWGILFAVTCILNIVFVCMSDTFYKSIREERMIQGIAFLFSWSLCSIVLGTGAIIDSSVNVFVVACVLWILLLILYTANGFDRNEGTLFWVVTSGVQDIKTVRFRLRRMLKRFANNMLACVVVVFPILVVNTIEFYYVNMNTLEFRVSDFWGTMLVQAILITLTVAVFLTCLSSGATKIIGSICMGIAVAAYLQVMIFNRDIGITDTHDINWGAYQGKMIINAIIWCACIIIPLVLYKIFARKAFVAFKAVMMILIVVQASAVVYDLVRCGGYNNTAGARPTEYYVSGENEFTVSGKKNIVVFILDTFSNDFLDNMLDSYPDELDYLKDFTYYDNYDSKYDGTALAMNYLLTGTEFDNSVPCREYSKAAFESDKAQSFYSFFKKQGYTCNLYTDKDTAGFVGTLNIYGLFDNVKKEYAIDTVSDRQKIRKNILKGSLYRWLPLALKRYRLVVTTDFDGCVSVAGRDDSGVKLDEEFYSELKNEGLELDNNAGNFMIYHFEGMHSFGNDRYSKSHNMAESARGNLEDVYSYIDELKKLGIYDNTSIIITADHGVHETKDGIQPIFFVKRAGQTQEKIHISNAPISAEEFMPTLVALAGGDSSSYGSTIYDYAEDSTRSRTVYVRKKKQNISDVIRSDSTSSYVYLYGYTYDGDKEALRSKDDDKPDIKLPLMDFWH